MFQRIPLNKGAVTIYSYIHGTHVHGTGPSERVESALAKEARKFSTRDYVISEGFENWGRVPSDVWKKGMLWDMDSLLHKIGVRQGTYERPEWYFMRLGNADEYAKIMEYNERLFTLPPEQQQSMLIGEHKATGLRLEEFRDMTTCDTETWQKIKESSIEKLVEDTGVPESVAREYTEETTTFRSLLMARTSYLRAGVSEGDVRLFCGLFHGKEIEQFLSEEESQHYIAGSSERMQRIFLENEKLQALVSETFANNRHKFPSHLHKRFLRWIAYKTYNRYLTSQDSNMLIINIAEFRKMIPYFDEHYS